MASRTRGLTRFRALVLLILAVLIGMTAVNATAGSPASRLQEEGQAGTSEEPQDDEKEVPAPDSEVDEGIDKKAAN